MVQQNYFEVLGRAWVWTDQDVARMRVTVHKSMLEDHVCKNLDQSFSNQFGIEAHCLDLFLLCDLLAFNEVHDDEAV